MGEQITKPGWDSWVGVPLDVQWYARRLESRASELQARLADIGSLYAEEFAGRDRRIKELERRIRKLEHALALAEERLRLSSQNSSKPPSSDPLSTPKRAARVPTGKRRGGQPRHRFHGRTLVPVEQCTSVTDHTPERCAKCEADLTGEDPDPLRHQIFEIPVPQPRVFEHRLHSLQCACGHLTRACLPEGVTANGFGPGVEGTVATLAGACRLSHRMIVSVMRDLFGIPLGLGTVTRILARSSQAIEQPVEAAREFVRWYEGAKYVDETGWFQRGADGTNEDELRAWLWAAVTAPVTYFEITLSRGKGVARQLLGEVAVGTVVSDRYSAYRFIDVEQRQLCWAHLYRDFVRISERSGRAGQIGRQLKKQAESLFALWGRYRDGPLDPAVWESETRTIRWRMKKLLEQGAGLTTRSTEKSQRSMTKNTCAELLELEPAMWLFLEKPGVGMTNNDAERALRHAVLLRRVSFGSQSEAGARTMARLLTVVMTLRSRGESVHKYLMEASRAMHEGRPAPSLLPAEAAAAPKRLAARA